MPVQKNKHHTATGDDRFRALFEQSLDAAYIGTPDGRILEVNQAWLALFGYSRDELPNVRAIDFYVNPAERVDFLRRIEETGIVQDEVLYKRKNGAPFICQRSLVAQRDQAGAVHTYHGINRDISQLRKAETLLRASETRYRSLFERSVDAIYIGTPDGNVIDVNQAWLDLFGYTREELPNLRAADFYADTTDRDDFIHRIVESGFVQDEVRYKRKDGTVFDCQRTQVALTDESGKLVAYQGVNRDISQLKKAESDIRESEQRFRALFEQSMDAIYIVAPDGTSLEANQAWLDLFGYKREDLPALKASDLYADPVVRDDFLRRIGETGFVRDTVRFRKKDGTAFDCERTVVELRDRSGELVAYQGVNRDITQRKHAERELLESESKYRTLFEHAMDAISLVSPGGLLLEANQTYLDLFGYTKDDIGGTNVEEQYVNADDRTRLLEALGRYGELVDDEAQLRKFDGTVMDCVRTAVTRRDADGTIIGDQSVIRDITAQKKAEEALRRSEAYNRSIVEVIPDLIIRVNSRGELLDVVASSDDKLALPRNELAGKKIADILSNEDAVRAQKTIEEALRANSLETMEYELAVPAGKRWFEARFTPSGREEAVALIRDITERKRAEQELRESEERFSQLAAQSRTWAWEVDCDGLYTYVDDIAEQVIGYRPEELVSKKHFYDLYPEALRDEFKTARLHIIQNGRELVHFENPVANSDGRTLWFSTSGIPLRRDDGHLLGYRGWDVDITAQRQGALALGESEARFRTLFERSTDAIYVVDYDGSNLRANPAWLKLFGYSADEMSRLNIIELYANPDDRKDLLKAMARKALVDDEVRFKRKDGMEFDCARTVTAQRDEEGNIVAFQGIMRDVTEQKRARAELEHLAHFDTLTGLLNRHAILDKLDEWLRQSKRYKGNLSIAMVDIDHFKRVNDLHGHLVGDRVLSDTADALRRSVRLTDFVGRYGGEEFLLILPQTGAAGAMAVAERARSLVRKTPMVDAEGGAISVTVSLGVAEWCHGDDMDALVGRADAALYRAKEAGRNRVEVTPLPAHDRSEK